LHEGPARQYPLTGAEDDEEAKSAGMYYLTSRFCSSSYSVLHIIIIITIIIINCFFQFFVKANYQL